MLYVLLVFFYAETVLSANILVLSPAPSPSHYIWNRALSHGLVNKGHNVTILTPDKDDSAKPQNFTHIFLEGLYEIFYEHLDVTPNEMATYSSAQMMLMLPAFSEVLCKNIFSNKNFEKLLDYPSDFFDLIVFDISGFNCFYPLINKFNYPPAVGVTPFLLPSYVSYSFGNQVNPAFVPWHSFGYTKNMNFEEKVWNFLFTYFEVVLRYLYQYKTEHQLAREIFGEDTPTIEELERHISLVLANTDPVLEIPQPLAPNIIAVGGLHTRKSKNITKDLQTILDGAKNGAIVFSLGSNVRSDKLDAKTQKMLLEAFSRIPETVIWKFESDLENVPKNVFVRKWLPQNDLLGHPNVKLFIGHGGALSTQEAMFHAVPMICIPFFADQHLNTKNIIDKKLGIALNFANMTTDTIYKSVRHVLDNPLYSNNMKQISDRFRDRPETPLERGVFWIEYVLRHGGAHFLNSPARDLPFYQSSGLDVLSFLILITVMTVFVLFMLLKVILTVTKSTKKIKVN